jgi:hypothetical protein
MLSVVVIFLILYFYIVPSNFLKFIMPTEKVFGASSTTARLGCKDARAIGPEMPIVKGPTVEQVFLFRH